MIVFGKSCCIWERVVVIGQGGCILAKVVVFGQRGCIWANVVVIRQCGIGLEWLYFGKVVILLQKLW